MNRLAELWSKEPAAIMAALGAILAALVVPEGWAKVVMAVVPLILGAITRSKVYSPATVQQLTRPPGG